MKSRKMPHDWKITSGYDPAQDGPDPAYGRIGVKCSVCEEERRVGASLTEMRAVGGCFRSGGMPYQEGDLLAVQGGGLDEFEGVLPDGQVLTWNAGGQHRSSKPEDVRPA